MKTNGRSNPNGGLSRLFRLLIAAAVWLSAWAPAQARPLPQEAATEDGWPMAASNPQRTSWTPEEVRGDLKPEWFQHFDAYIPQRVQIVASGGRLFLSTAKGLYALNAENGSQLWFYPTDLPLGHSPTLSNGVLYVGGFDGLIHAIQASSGARMWTFKAGAGFQTNPLVVEGKVFAGSRDGSFYALNASSGALVWKFQTGAPILFSAAYSGGDVYFASNDNHAYALRAADGSLVWKSDKLPGHGFHSFWPVVAGEHVIFPGSYNYRYVDPFPGPHTELEREGAFPSQNKNDSFAAVASSDGPWADGTDTVDATAAAEYFEEHPHRRTIFIFDRASGEEVSLDLDGDGNPEYAPLLWFGTHSGTRFPPALGQDGVLYQSAPLYYDRWIPRGRIVGWQPGSPILAIPRGSATAVDEPLAYAIGGSTVYWKRCCDRMAGAFQIQGAPGASLQSWTYFNEGGQALRFALPELFDKGWDFAYWKHGDSSPPLPYQGRVYIILNNAIVAFSPNGRSAASRSYDPGLLTGEKAGDIERDETLEGLITRLTAGKGTWPQLIAQESYYNTDSRPEARARYFPLFQISIPGAEPGDLVVETGRAASRLEAPFSGGVLQAWTSQRAPGTLFHTEAQAYRLEGALTGMAYPTAGGVRRVSGSGTLTGADMSAGWLLVWDQSPTHRWMPLLISLENRPSRIAYTEQGMEITFSGAAGHLALTPVYGMGAPQSTEAQTWSRTGLPEVTLERLRLLDRLARAFPIKSEEKWTVDGVDAVLDFSYTFREFSGAWGTEPLPAAYLPPQLALAAWGESPIRIADQPLSSHMDLEYVTPLGRAAAVAGESRASALLPGAAIWRSGHARPGIRDFASPYQTRLVDEIELMLQAGHLRPAYGITGIWEAASRSRIGNTLIDYWHNPADTTYTLLLALPYLPPALQRQVQRYVHQEFKDYPLHTTAHVGWRDPGLL
jgi:outer membrane protein assembly factor BamB